MGLRSTTVVANGSPKRANLGCISQIDDTPETDGNINDWQSRLWKILLLLFNSDHSVMEILKTLFLMPLK